MRLELVGEGPGSSSIRVAVAHDLVLGREGDGAGRFEDGQLSRRHARLLVAADGSARIEDLGSANGTWVDGRRIDGPTPLSRGGEVRMGQMVLKVQAVGSPAPPVPTEQVASPSRLGRIPEPSGPSGPSGPSAGEVALLHGGDRISLSPAGVRLGRGPGNDIVLPGDIVSHEHAYVGVRDGRWFVSDLGTTNGTLLNGERLHGQSRWLHAGDRIALGQDIVSFLAHDGADASALDEILLDGRTLQLGRDPTADVVLDDPRVSRRHAEIRSTSGGAQVVDAGSRNGTLVDGRPVKRAQLRPGVEIVIGPFRLLYTGTGLLRRDDRGALYIEASGLSVQVGSRRILNDANLTIEPGQFVVIIGESGAGKSTLLRALAGVSRPTTGSVTVNGDPVAVRLPDIGFVPQDEIIHQQLTIREALRYAARLRLPGDSSPQETEAAVERVLGELALDEHADTRIGSLSGGQRKRAGMAAELLTQPSVLFLDEPTTGLDPGLESRMMELFRRLAEPGVRSVTVVTHATKNLQLADRVCVMGRGGELAFVGAPDEARRFFGVETYDDIYTALDDLGATTWRAQFDLGQVQRGGADGTRTDPRIAPVTTWSHSRASPADPAWRQLRVLTARYLRLFGRDTRNLALLVGQVPLIALGIALLFRANVFAERPSDAAQLLFLLSTTAIWLGSIDGARELIKESALADREQAMGVRLVPYLGSKAIVLCGLVAVQITLLLATVSLLQPLGGGVNDYAAVWLVLALTGVVAVGLGLLISASVSTEDQASSLIPLVLIPQLLFAGAIVPVATMRDPIDLLSNLAFSRWSFAGLGSAIDLPARIAANPQFAAANPYGDFFDGSLGTALTVLAGFAVAAGTGIAALLRARRGWR